MPNDDDTTPTTDFCILIVDDEADVAREIGEGLTEDGYRCAVAASAADAIDRIMASPRRYGVVVTDIKMPGMDGVALTRCLLGAMSAADCPEFVLVTGHAVPRELAAAFPGITIEVVRKPFRWAEFIAPVERAVARAVARR